MLLCGVFMALRLRRTGFQMSNAGSAESTAVPLVGVCVLSPRRYEHGTPWAATQCSAWALPAHPLLSHPGVLCSPSFCSVSASFWTQQKLWAPTSLHNEALQKKPSESDGAACWDLAASFLSLFLYLESNDLLESRSSAAGKQHSELMSEVFVLAFRWNAF